MSGLNRFASQNPSQRLPFPCAFLSLLVAGLLTLVSLPAHAAHSATPEAAPTPAPAAPAPSSRPQQLPPPAPLPPTAGAAPITLTANSLDLDELCAELSKQAGITLAADRDTQDHKVTGRFVKRPLKEVIQAVEDLFGFRLRYYEKTKRYVLYRGAYDQRKLAIQNSGREDLRKRFEALDKVYAKDPRINEAYNVFPRLMTQLSPEAVDHIFKGETFQIPFKQLSQEDQKAIYEKFSWRITYVNPDKTKQTPPLEEFTASQLRFLILGEPPNISLVTGVPIKKPLFTKTYLIRRVI